MVPPPSASPQRNVKGASVANAASDRRNGIPKPQPILAPNWWLGLVPRELWDRKKTFFIYEIDFTPLAASQTSVNSTQIQNDSHFLIVAGVSLVTDSAGAVVINAPNGANSTGKLVTIRDVAAGFPLSQVPVPVENMFGTGMLPAVWAIPKLIRKGSTLEATVQNLIATAHNVRLSFWGVRIYPDIPQD